MSVKLAVPQRFDFDDADEAKSEASNGVEPNPYAYDEFAAHDGLDFPRECGDAEAISISFQKGVG